MSRSDEGNEKAKQLRDGFKEGFRMALASIESVELAKRKIAETSDEGYFKFGLDIEQLKRLEACSSVAKQVLNSKYGLPDGLAKSYIYPTSIKRRGSATIVRWRDGSQTKIVLEKGKGDAGLFHAFCVAFAKKYFGSTDKLMKAIESADDERQQVEKKAAEEKAKKEKEEKRLKAEQNQFEREVKKKVREALIDAEVRRRLDNHF